MRFVQLQKEQWEPGDFVPVALLSISSNELARELNMTFRDFWEDGLGNAREAGFRTPDGRQFSIIEYTNGPQGPATYIFALNHPATMVNDLDDILDSLRLSRSDLKWVDANAERKLD